MASPTGDSIGPGADDRSSFSALRFVLEEKDELFGKALSKCANYVQSNEIDRIFDYLSCELLLHSPELPSLFEFLIAALRKYSINPESAEIQYIDRDLRDLYRLLILNGTDGVQRRRALPYDIAVDGFCGVFKRSIDASEVEKRLCDALGTDEVDLLVKSGLSEDQFVSAIRILVSRKNENIRV